MALKTLFFVFVAFYATVKLSFFVGIYFITKSIERKALAEKQKRKEHNRLAELELIVDNYQKKEKAFQKDKEEYGSRRHRFIS